MHNIHAPHDQSIMCIDSASVGKETWRKLWNKRAVRGAPLQAIHVIGLALPTALRVIRCSRWRHPSLHATASYA